jgi:hypothetical protein
MTDYTITITASYPFSGTATQAKHLGTVATDAAQATIAAEVGIDEDDVEAAFVVDVDAAETPAPVDDGVLCIDKQRALRLFTEWHVDEGTNRAAARDYARRLWARLATETVAGVA